MTTELIKEDRVSEAWLEITQILDELEAEAGVDRDFTVGMLEAIADGRRQ